MEAGMGMTSSLNASTTADGARRLPQRAATGANATTHVGRPPSSPTTGASPGPGGQTQHEVLQNFFQSLLSSRDRGGATATAKSVGPKTNGNTSGTDDTS